MAAQTVILPVQSGVNAQRRILYIARNGLHVAAVVVNQARFVQKRFVVKQRFAALSAYLEWRLVLVGWFDETENICQNCFVE